MNDAHAAHNRSICGGASIAFMHGIGDAAPGFHITFRLPSKETLS
jgi:hypothetical protein